MLALVLVPAPARADRWYVHYENAERALAEQDWRRAVEELQQALERRGDSGLRVRSYGMKVVDYFPYLKLGIAYHHLGQHDAALEAFDTEERLGVAQGSAAARAELADYRQRATTARAELAAAARRRANEGIEAALRQARELEDQGRFDEAMAVLGRGLALEPENAEANQLMSRLGERSLEAERARRAAAARVPAAEAPAARDRGATLVPPLPSPLPAPAQTSAGTVGTGSPDRVAAAEPEASPAPSPAPPPEQALALDALREAEAHLGAGRFEEALAAANRALAASRSPAAVAQPGGDRLRPEALVIIRRAYDAISRRVLGGGEVENLPPAIRFADQRTEEDEPGLAGERVEVVRRADFRLSGVVLDRSPVKLELFDEAERPVAVSSSTQALGELFITEFRVERRLPAGASRLTVVATDGEGLSSRGEYRVHYRRPWFRSPWFAAGLLALVAGALGAGFARRARQRSRRRLRRFNPYVAGGPIFDEALFFGREVLIQRVLQTVHNNSLLLYGERRIGKTSLLHQLARRLEALEDPALEFFSVYIDLQGTPEERLFATLADAIHEALAPHLAETGRTAALTRPVYNHHDLVQELHHWLKALAARSSKGVKLVLLVDEIDELNHYDPRVNQSLRSLFMKRFSQNLAAVVAGVGIRKQWEKEGSPWYNFFEEIAVEPIAEADALRLVLEPSRGAFRFEAAAARRIVEESGGRPFLIQRRCLALLQRLHELGRATVTLADLDAVPPAPRAGEAREGSA